MAKQHDEGANWEEAWWKIIIALSPCRRSYLGLLSG